MEHQEAVSRQAAERYVLGELPPGEREAFEEHFFQCPACAEEVRLGALVLANVRAVLAEDVRLQSTGRVARLLAWKPLAPVALAACLILLLSTAYLGLVSVPALQRELAALRAPQAYPAIFLRPVVRGEEQLIEAPRGSAFLGLSLDLPPESRFASYRCRLFTQDGRLAASIDAPAPASPGAPLNLLLSTAALHPGSYTLVLTPGEGSRSQQELSRFHFRIQFK